MHNVQIVIIAFIVQRASVGGFFIIFFSLLAIILMHSLATQPLINAW